MLLDSAYRSNKIDAKHPSCARVIEARPTGTLIFLIAAEVIHALHRRKRALRPDRARHQLRSKSQARNEKLPVTGVAHIFTIFPQAQLR